MLEYLLLAAVGCLLGTITGLTPGLHVNTVCLLGLSTYPALGLTVHGFAVMMASMSVTHTFLDFIPGIFLGVPDEETALSILPAHQLLLKGESLTAVKLTAIGSLIGLATALILLAPAVKLLPIIYNGIRSIVVYIIILVSILLILREKKRMAHALLIFLLTGWLGTVILEMKALSSSQVLFPAFAGLFGLSTIILSLKTKPNLVPQKPFAVMDVDAQTLGAGFLGSLGGIAVGVLPSLSPSQIGIVMSRLYGRSIKRFLVSISAINTSDAIYSLIALYAIGNPRSGVAVMLSKIMEVDSDTLVLLVGSMAFSAIVAYTIHLQVGRSANKIFSRLNYQGVSLTVIAFITLTTIALTGWLGLLILVTSTATGFLPPMTGVSRTHLMGILIIPTTAFMLGI